MLINKQNDKQMEPLDNDIPIRKPAKVKSILQLTFEKNFYTVSSLLDLLRVDIEYLVQLTGIQKAFFIEHKESEQKQFSISELKIK